MKEPMTFSWISTEREKQVVKFNTLREDFAGQVFLLRHFSGVVAPIIAGHHAGTFRGLKV